MILTVTLNAAIDKRYVIDKFQVGEVNRTTSTQASAGGKGLNVARVCHLLGEPVIATGFVGGFSGQYIENEIKKLGIEAEFCYVDGESRTCINMYDKATGVQTEVLEGGITVTAADEERFKDMYSKLVDKCNIVAISGSVPTGSSPAIYNELVAIAKAKGKKVLLDTSKDYLKSALDSDIKPTMIKPNTDELAYLLDKTSISTEEAISAAKNLFDKGIELVVISMGKDGSVVAYENQLYNIVIPAVKTVNSVGCGDSMIAGFAAGLNRGLPIAQIIKLASASGTSNALSEATGFVDPAQVEELSKQVVVEKLSMI
ncbi:1-phosphofructokinase family hexose kinase [Candidatus Epulonipiscium viviparus]|uniref:1-phosphofructokinase family hexose kinase n=1 Tax=Candidatus Epulonipiscium viviparus TaxID=420336 RepID=UPI00016C0B26|nr:1-phosphofructokinase family hexose kinase [Candidatus Epulopiscium viviparus]